MNSKIKTLALCAVWCVIAMIFVTAYKYWWMPKKEAVVKQQEQIQQQETIAKTSSKGRFKFNVRMGIDSFSGYAILRSQRFLDRLAENEIGMSYADDKANYQERLQKLEDGELDMAVFTIDALIKIGAKLNKAPASVICIIDETTGADVVVAGKSLVDIDSLNDPALKIVCVPDSPSETLARVLMTSFKLERLQRNPFLFVDSPEAVVEEYRRSNPTDKKVFATWEPYASTMLKNPDYHDVFNSSKFRGYLVDVIVVRRGFLLKNEEQVTAVIKSYLSSVYDLRPSINELVLTDSQDVGQPLIKADADTLAKKIWWKNTQENFAHFGLIKGEHIQHIDDICANITRALARTGGISHDPVEGKYNQLYYDGILRKLHDSNWHPGSEIVREGDSSATLSEDDWKRLHKVGTLQVPRLVFARGSSKLTPLSLKTLDELVENLKTFPQYYLTVVGNVAGGTEADKQFALERSQSAIDYLIGKGISKNKMKSDSALGSSTVEFIVGERPY